MIFELVNLVTRRPMRVEKVCTKLMCSEAELNKAVTRAAKQGYNVRTVDGYVMSGVRIGQGDTLISLGSERPGRKHVAIATDIHFGSTHCDRDALLSFLETAWERRCRVLVMTGDILDGNKDVLLPDQRKTTFDGQVGECLTLFKKAPPFQTVFIDGNHDGYFSSSMGTMSGRILGDRAKAAGLDWTYLGACLGRATISGARWQLWHPHGGASTRNAVRRVLNERAEAMTDDLCHVLAMGHYHKYVSLPTYPEGVFTVAGGTFQQKRSEFANRIARPWDVGGTIVSYTARDLGPSEFSAEFYPVAS